MALEKDISQNAHTLGAVSDLVAETGHSILRVHQWQNANVVVKRCRQDSGAQAAERFRNEVTALMVVKAHDNVATILDSDSSDLAITLKLEPGQSLDKFVNDRNKSTLSSRQASLILKQMASALVYVHSKSIIHDDVKPDNIMWSPDHGHSVLIDFGAAIIDMPKGYFHPSGTPNYAPPEFLYEEKSPKGDIWGLGITMLFAYGHVSLPDGEWILPHALDESTQARREMSAWLAEVDHIRSRLTQSMPVLATMLEANPVARPDSEELSRKLDHLSECH